MTQKTAGSRANMVKLVRIIPADQCIADNIERSAKRSGGVLFYKREDIEDLEKLVSLWSGWTELYIAYEVDVPEQYVVLFQSAPIDESFDEYEVKLADIAKILYDHYDLDCTNCDEIICAFNL